MIWYPYEQMKTMREPYKIVVQTESISIQRIRSSLILFLPGGA